MIGLGKTVTLNTGVLNPMTQTPTGLCIFWDSSHVGQWDPNNIPSSVFPDGTVTYGTSSAIGPYIGWYDAGTYFTALKSGLTPLVYTITVG